MDKHCRICHNTSCSNHGKNISFLGEGWKCNYIPVPTNADRIRAMSDEELDYFLHKVTYGMDECPYEYGSEKALEWLQQPVASGRRTIMICNDCLLKDYCYWNNKVNFIGCEMKRTSNTDTCVACGAPVPEGTQVCGKCGGQNE